MEYNVCRWQCDLPWEQRADGGKAISWGGGITWKEERWSSATARQKTCVNERDSSGTVRPQRTEIKVEDFKYLGWKKSRAEKSGEKKRKKKQVGMGAENVGCDVW